MALIHRAFHAIPFLTTKDGELTNAVFGFTSSVLTVLSELDPKYAAVAFDLPEPTFRHRQYADYKATRQRAPDELKSQFGRVREVVEALGMPIFEKAGYEADDIIGSLAKQIAASDGVEPYIVTGDRDALQLVDDQVRVFMLKWRPGGRETVTYDPAVLQADTGLNAAQYLQYKALRGDASDNIPGVPGVGEKTATMLVARYETIEKVYDALAEDPAKHPEIKPKIRQSLLEHREQALLSRDLARIVTDVTLPIDLPACTLKDFDFEQAQQLFRKLEFTSLLPRLKQLAALEADVAQPAAAVGQREWPGKTYQLVTSQAELTKLVGNLESLEAFAIDTETATLDAIRPQLCGISLSWQADHGYYLPLRHDAGPTLDYEKTLAALRPVLESSQVGKVGHHLKYDWEVLRGCGITMQGLQFDTLLGSYLLNPGARSLGLSTLAHQELGYDMQPIEELIGSGKGQLSMQSVASQTAGTYAAEDADITWQLYEKLSAQLRETGLERVLAEIELPLVPVLGRMEQHGVKLDTAFLAKLAKQFGSELGKLERQAYALAGHEFNLNSPAQLATVLFDELKLGGGSSRAGGKHKSTAAGHLEKLADAHPLVPLILRYRELAKLQSTYVDALPKLVRRDTGRLHTSYNQTVAATGRLSSSDPNLQNIPIRTELGREIRKAFVADRGMRLLSADYSQFELRIAAHISGDPKLSESFRAGEDIHAATAAKVAGVPLDQVTPEQRYAAKAVNFSILYGATPHGVARSTGMSVSAAADYIEQYFKTYPKLKEYMEAMVAKAETDGYVETLFGRRRYLPEIRASVYPVREAAKRMAINMPVQGTQADILKLAMISIDRDLPAVSKASRMILTVHDELVFEVPTKEVTAVAKFVRAQMEGAYALDVPVTVEAKVGSSWGVMQSL